MMKMKRKEGLIYKGHFWPLYGGGNLYNSDMFYSGGMDGICPTLRAEKSDAAVCVEYENGLDDMPEQQG